MGLPTDLCTSRRVQSGALFLPRTSLLDLNQRDSRCLATIDMQGWRFRFQLGLRLRPVSPNHLPRSFPASSLLRGLAWFTSFRSPVLARLRASSWLYCIQPHVSYINRGVVDEPQDRGLARHKLKGPKDNKTLSAETFMCRLFDIC